MPTRIYLNDVYPYDIPDFKGDEKNIINFDIKNKEDQFWTKQPLPNFEKITQKQLMDWIWVEEERRRNGCFFLNNGELTYINGKHYRFLQYYTGDFEEDLVEKKEPSFWDAHRLYFYFLEFSDNYEFSVGDVTIKPRRRGFTQIHNSDALECGISNINAKIGLMSATKDMAKDGQFLPIRDAIACYEKHFRPIFKTNGNSLFETKMEFKNNNINNDVPELGGSILYNSPIPNAYDGKKLKKFKFDEFLKLEGKGFENALKPQLKTMWLPHTNKIIGKASLFSTMGTNDKTMRYAISEGRRLWDTSNYEERDEKGWTASGFLRYFVSCYDVLLVDKYGFSNREEAEKEQERKLKLIIESEGGGEGSFNHIQELRENPRTINDVFDSPKLGTLFNITGRISNRERIVLNTPIKDRPYVCGKFREDMKTNTIFFDTSEEYKDYGWKITQLLPPEKANRVKIYNGIYALDRNPETSIGYDPVKLDEHISDHVSDPAILIYKKFDQYSNTGVENQIIGTYIGRKDDNDEVSEQCAFAGRYFGALLCVERNVGTKWFAQNGYSDMCIISPYDKMRGIHIGTGKARKPLSDGIEFINDYVKKPKGDDVDWLDTIWFEELLDQLKTFEADALTTHDLIAAFVQACIGANSLKPTILNGNTPMANMFWKRKY